MLSKSFLHIKHRDFQEPWTKLGHIRSYNLLRCSVGLQRCGRYVESRFVKPIAQLIVLLKSSGSGPYSQE